ncbi:MAG TPA: glycosyltransferase [Bryobacterales bacterium]|nr:glycosyltransferase [Bryobacterales bacterium]
MLDSTPVLPCWILFWFFSGAAVILGLASLRAASRRLQAIAAEMQQEPPPFTPSVTLIVPVKGREEGLVDNLRSLLTQDYPDFEMLIAVRDGADPAVAEVAPLVAAGVRLVVAGPPPANTGEKIGNLLAAVAQARASTQVLAFADSDGRVARGWLRGLVAPLADPAVGASTGYRWYFPQRAAFWPLIRSVWNAAIAGGFVPGRQSPPAFAWGGAMALRRETFDRARVPDFWLGSLSDDYRLTQAVRAAGLQIRFSPCAMVATEGDCSAAEFFAWAVRQLTITRVYRPRLWWLGFAAHILYCGAMLAGILAIATGALWAIPILLLATVPGMASGALRGRSARLLFPDRAPWLARHAWIYFWLTLPATWIWLAVFVASLARRRIEWRGNTYELLSPAKTRPITATRETPQP